MVVATRAVITVLARSAAVQICRHRRDSESHQQHNHQESHHCSCSHCVQYNIRADKRKARIAYFEVPYLG